MLLADDLAYAGDWSGMVDSQRHRIWTNWLRRWLRLDLITSILAARCARRPAYPLLLFAYRRKIGWSQWMYTSVNIPIYDPGSFCPEATSAGKCRDSQDQGFYVTRRRRRCSSKLSSQCELGHYRIASYSLPPANWICAYFAGQLPSLDSVEMNYPKRTESSAFFTRQLNIFGNHA